MTGLTPRLALFTLLSLPLTVTALEPGERAPAWELSTPAGQVVRYPGDAAGHASVVLFWATWCPYCRSLMPHIQVLAEEFRERPVRFYALNVWEDGDPVAYMTRQGFSFTLLLNADPVAPAWGVPGTPGLFVLDPDGRVVYRRGSGATDDEVEADMRGILDALLAQRASSP